MTFTAPEIDYAGLSPLIALTGTLIVVLLSGLAQSKAELQRGGIALLTLLGLGVTQGLVIWQWGEEKDLVAGALRLDGLALTVATIAIVAAAFCVLLSLNEPASDTAGRGEYHALLIGSVLGMVLLAEAQNLVTLFVAIELLSIPLYILCASATDRRESLESGLKYLIIGSLGSATLLYGLAFLYGGAGSTDFAAIADALRSEGLAGDPLLLVGIGLSVTGLAFKASVAPFHQWTPDAYQGAPTPITAFMAVATKAAAFAVLVRLFMAGLGPAAEDWSDALAVLAALTIIVGNVGALGQDSLKRLLAWSGVAQAGYILAGLVVFSEAGVNALVFYLAAYTLMNLAAFAVVVARERDRPDLGDSIAALEGIGRDRPLLAWPMTIAMLSLAGMPATAGFIGKFFLIEATVDGDRTWLAVAIVIGTMISLAYYLRVVAAIWMRPGAEPLEAKTPGEMGLGGGGRERWELTLPACLAAGAVIAFGVAPSPLVDWAAHAGAGLAGLF